jgi:hypothetical protein
MQWAPSRGAARGRAGRSNSRPATRSGARHHEVGSPPSCGEPGKSRRISPRVRGADRAVDRLLPGRACRAGVLPVVAQHQVAQVVPG